MIQLEAYLREIYNFLRTVTIKNELFADHIRNKTIGEYDLEQLPEEENPYYLNICGEYSPYDTQMYITSIDTGEQVLFSKDLHVSHPKTISLYKIPNKEFTTLCQKYPNQVDLIKAIVYPVGSISNAIASKDLTMLGYDSSLLDKEEAIDIVNGIHDLLDMYRRRYWVKEFGYEELYPMALWSTLWLHLQLFILGKRFTNIRSSYTHDYHIWEYLSSKGLGDYRSVLKKQQSLFLYRNMNYLLHNKGCGDNLKLLADNLLNKVNVSLISKSVVLNTKDKDDCKLRPIIISEDLESSTTPLQNCLNRNDPFESLIEKEYDNDLEINNELEYIAEQKERFSNIHQTYLPTKLLELHKNQFNLRYETHYIDFMLQSLLYYMINDKLQYTNYVQIPLLNTYILLTQSESIALLHYCLKKEVGETPVNIPNVFYFNNTFNLNPSITSNFVLHGNVHLTKSYINVDEYLSLLGNTKSNISSSNEMIEYFTSQYDVYHHILFNLRNDNRRLHNRALYLFLNDMLYQDKQTIDLLPENNSTTYEEWFNEKKILKDMIDVFDNTNNSTEQYSLLAENIINTMLPFDNLNNSRYINTDKFKDVHYLKLKKLFTQMCSYNIAFLDTVRNVSSYASLSPVNILYNSDERDACIITSNALLTPLYWDTTFDTNHKDFGLICRDKKQYIIGKDKFNPILNLTTASTSIMDTDYLAANRIDCSYMDQDVIGETIKINITRTFIEE